MTRWNIVVKSEESKRLLKLSGTNEDICITTNDMNIPIKVDLSKCVDCYLTIGYCWNTYIKGLKSTRLSYVNTDRVEFEDCDLSLVDIKTKDLTIVNCTNIDKLKVTAEKITVKCQGLQSFAMKDVKCHNLILENLTGYPEIINPELSLLRLVNSEVDLSRINCTNLKNISISHSKVIGEFLDVNTVIHSCELAWLDIEVRMTDNFRTLEIIESNLEKVKIITGDTRDVGINLMGNNITHLKIDNPRNVGSLNVIDNKLQNLPIYNFLELLPSFSEISTIDDMILVEERLKEIRKNGISASGNPLIYPNGEEHDHKDSIYNYCFECERQLRFIKSKSAAK